MSGTLESFVNNQIRGNTADTAGHHERRAPVVRSS